VKQLLEQTLEDRLAYLLNGSTIKQPQLMSDVDAVERKKELFARRQVEIELFKMMELSKYNISRTSLMSVRI